MAPEPGARPAGGYGLLRKGERSYDHPVQGIGLRSPGGEPGVGSPTEEAGFDRFLGDLAIEPQGADSPGMFRATTRHW